MAEGLCRRALLIAPDALGELVRRVAAGIGSALTHAAPPA